VSSAEPETKPESASAPEPTAILRAEGDRLVPTHFAQGPWNPNHLHGGPICGVLGRAIEACESPGAMRVVRMTVEMTRAVPMAPFTVRAEVTRSGRRIQQVDAFLEAGGQTLARATGLRMRVGELDAETAVTQDEPVPVRRGNPDDLTARPTFLPGFIHSFEFLRSELPHRETGGVIWARLVVPLVEGEPVSPFVRLATICDFASGTGNALDFARFTSINPDLSLHVLREPRGEWIGIRGWTGIEPDGIAVSHATIFDDEGVVARALVSLLVERR
jgi:acyl-coenzyme A thioesterase PaaI-like protein